MNPLIFLFLFDRAMAIPAGVIAQTVSCGELIEASARFKREPSVVRADATADIVPFIEPESRALRPFLQPLKLTTSEFLRDVLIRGRMPALREYLSLVTAGPPPAPQDFLKISVDLAQVNQLLSRGTLPFGDAMKRVDPARTLRPADQEIVLVFRGRVLQLQRDARVLPIWDLVAIVTGAGRHAEVQRTLQLRSGYAPEGLLKSNGWVASEPIHSHVIPLTFKLELNPLEVFALMRSPSTEDAFRTDFLRQGFNVSYDFWLPFAHSDFDVTLANGDRFRGTLIGLFPEARELTFLADGEHETVPIEMLDRIVLRKYRPNRPDGRKIVIDTDLDHVQDVIDAYLDEPYLDPSRFPLRQVIISGEGVDLNP